MTSPDFDFITYTPGDLGTLSRFFSSSVTALILGGFLDRSALHVSFAHFQLYSRDLYRAIIFRGAVRAFKTTAVVCA
jgi:hypothetical protein